MSILRKSGYATAAVIGAAALTATLAMSAHASAWEYGSGYGSSSAQAHGAALTDLESTYWGGCRSIKLVSDTYQGNYGNMSWYAVVEGFCTGPLK
jgi:hypothetical protein